MKNFSFLCIDEELQKIYTVNETKEYMGRSGGGVTQLSYDSEGNMKREKTYNTEGSDPCHIVKSPDGYWGNNICSDLHLSPNGKYLYASNRGHDSITCYQIDDEGRLSMIQNISSEGNTPRNFAVDPSGNYILVGNQDSDQIAVFKIAENGTLHQENQIAFETPVCIKFFKRKIR